MDDESRYSKWKTSGRNPLEDEQTPPQKPVDQQDEEPVSRYKQWAEPRRDAAAERANAMISYAEVGS